MSRKSTSILAVDTKSPKYLENLYQLVDYGQMSSSAAAKTLGISKRQLLRRLKAWRSNGAKSFDHGNKGRSAPNRLSEEIREKIINLIQENTTGSLRRYSLSTFKNTKVSRSQRKLSVAFLGPCTQTPLKSSIGKQVTFFAGVELALVN